MGMGPAILPATVRYRQLSFERAARYYDAVSGVQRIMAGQLMDLLPGQHEAPQDVLELGCGTGHLSELLTARFPRARFLCTDLSRAMLEQARIRLGESRPCRVDWLQLDANRVREALRSCFDLVASSAMVQWIENLQSHLEGVAHHMRPGAHYLVSGFDTDNLPELADALGRIGVASSIGHSEEALERGCSRAALRVVAFRSESILQEYRDAREFFDVLRAMGASRYPEGRRLSPSALRGLMRDYGQRNPSAGGVSATWRPWYALLKR